MFDAVDLKIRASKLYIMSEQKQPKRGRSAALIDEVARAYVGAGWAVQMSPPRAPTHFTAMRGSHWHHVKVVDAAKEKTGAAADPSDVAKSDFVQNALSNKARPVYATVSESAGKTKVTYKDVNTGGAVRIAAAAKKPEETN